MDSNAFIKGKLYINGKCVEIENLEWTEHSVFKGVFLKHVIKGESTNDSLSCHLVKINPRCEIGIHNHTGKTELHEILSGSGQCSIGQTNMDYINGVVGFIPANIDHSIKADNDGLLLLAKFFPALV